MIDYYDFLEWLITNAILLTALGIMGFLYIKTLIQYHIALRQLRSTRSLANDTSVARESAPAINADNGKMGTVDAAAMTPLQRVRVEHNARIIAKYSR